MPNDGNLASTTRVSIRQITCCVYVINLSDVANRSPLSHVNPGMQTVCGRARFRSASTRRTLSCVAEYSCLTAAGLSSPVVEPAVIVVSQARVVTGRTSDR